MHPNLLLRSEAFAVFTGTRILCGTLRSLSSAWRFCTVLGFGAWSLAGCRHVSPAPLRSSSWPPTPRPPPPAPGAARQRQWAALDGWIWRIDASCREPWRRHLLGFGPSQAWGVRRSSQKPRPPCLSPHPQSSHAPARPTIMTVPMLPVSSPQSTLAFQ